MTPERSVPVELIAPEPADPATGPEGVEVGDLLAEVEDSLGRLVRENHRLRTKLVAIGAELDRLRRLAPAADNPEPPVLMRARRTAASYLDQADRQASRLISEARRDADQIVREAQASADAIEQSARQRHSQAVIGLESRLAALEQDADELQELEHEYRMRIRADLRDRLHELGDPDRR